MQRNTLFNFYFSSAQDGGDQHRSSFNAVGNCVDVRRMQGVASLNFKDIRADAVDLGSHRNKKLSEVRNFRLHRSIFDACCPFGKHRRHQDISRSTDARNFERNPSTLQVPGLRDDVAALKLYLGPQFSQSIKMEIYRTWTPCAASRERNFCPAVTRNQGSKDVYRRAH